MTAFMHQPVLLEAVLAGLRPEAGDVVLDCTVGGCGHAEALLAAGPCSVIAMDRDPDAVRHARQVAARWSGRLSVVHARFSEARAVLQERGVARVQILFADLGVSSPQLDTPSRGFSVRQPGPVDMRMSQSGPTAADLVDALDEEALAEILVRNGEVRGARRIARVLRAGRPWRDTVAMAQAVAAVVGGPPRGRHPATTVFLALRQAVNDEPGQLAALLADAPDLVAPGGRIGILTFHSLEDRAVKTALVAGSARALPRDAFGHAIGSPIWTDLRDVAPDPHDDNPRARSARLRLATRCP
jgi:16S rRNA (cytosine1402-N4)-methyltransferase